MPIITSHGSEEEAAGGPADFALQMITDGYITPASDEQRSLSLIQNGLVWPVE